MKDWPRHYILCQLLVGLLGHNQWNNEGSNECRKDGFFSISFSFFSLFLSGQESRQKRTAYIMCRDVGAGRAGGSTTPPDFFRSVNPMSISRVHIIPHILLLAPTPPPQIFRTSDISGTYVMRLGTAVMISLLMQLRLAGLKISLDPAQQKMIINNQHVHQKQINIVSKFTSQLQLIWI